MTNLFVRVFRRNYSKVFILMLSIGFFSSCGSLITKTAVSTTGAILSDASDEIWTEGNWQIFSNGIPGNLKMLEALYYLDPEDENILSGLVKAYAGYAYVVDETNYLNEEFNENEEGTYRTQALLNYSKAFLTSGGI